METKFRAAVLLATGITFVGGETILLAHHDIDVPQQPHTEHEYYPAPEESSFTLAASGIGNISITPATGSMEINGLQPLIHWGSL